jgi:hypothetical protein
VKTHNLFALLVALLLPKEVESQEFTVIYPSADMWLGNTYATSSQNGEFIRLGGWGDRYFAFWKFDWTKVRKDLEIDEVHLYLYPDPQRNESVKLVTSTTVWLLTTPWKENGTTIRDPLKGYNLGSYKISEQDGLKLDITALYEYWNEEPDWNYGIMLYPDQNDNKWYFFPSRESGNADRPRVVVYYKSGFPDFKLPLPTGKEWKLTVQAGGKDQDGEIDKNHTGEKYYSLDFAPESKTGTRISYELNVPILATAGGIVYESGFDYKYNGNFVRIDHDGDGDPKTGFQSVYLHMRDKPIVEKGDWVDQGEKIGIMGNTGLSFGTHLHFGLYYQAKGAELLKKVKLEGRGITTYKVGTRTKPKYYKSTNDVSVSHPQ